MNKNLYYFDLLDDGLYQPTLNLDEAADAQRLLDVLRFQFLLCILFGRTVVVPEQWLVSSATFREIAFEIVEHYPFDYVNERTTATTQRQHQLPLPIVFSFYNRETVESPLANYLTAFISRIDSKRRLQQSPLLSLESSAEGGSAREALRRALQDQFEFAPREAFGRDFVDDLKPLLGVQPAIRLSKVSQYIGRLSKRETRYFNMVAYHERMKGSLGRLRSIIDDPPYVAQLRGLAGGEDRLRLLRELFLAAEREQIALNQITDLWSVLPKLGRPMGGDGEHLQSLETLGRAIMHHALKEQSESEIGSLSIGLYRSAKASDAFEEAALRFISAPAFHIPTRESSSTEADDFKMSVMGNALSYDMAHRIAWPDIWKSVWEYAYSARWEKLSQRLQEDWTHDRRAGVRLEDALEAAFDDISSHLGSFVLQYRGGEHPYVELFSKRARAAGRALATADKAGAAAGKMAKALGVGEVSLTIGLGAVMELAKRGVGSPWAYRAMMRAERRLAADRNSRLIQNIWTQPLRRA